MDTHELNQKKIDERYMKMALNLALKGKGKVSPNPMVGAIIVKENKVIGSGYHKEYGKSHAEIEAINSSIEDLSNSTMYVNLEPCSHFGKTPPCVDVVIKNRISRVVIAMKDPNPIVSGSGIKKLIDNGIKVELRVLENEARKLNEIFIHYITFKTPFTVLKTAMTLDGKISTYTGDSKWITSDISREDVHKLRASLSAIIVGIGTVMKDNPMLNVRLNKEYCKDPHRIIVDSNAKINLDAKVLNIKSNASTYIAVTDNANDKKLYELENIGAKIIMTKSIKNKVDLIDLWKKLGDENIDSILLEGGETLNASMIEAGLVNKIRTYIAPKIIGGKDAKSPIGGVGISSMKDAKILRDTKVISLGEDFVIEGYL